MTPDNPGTPGEGKVDAAKTEQEADEAKAAETPKPKRRKPAVRKKKAEPKAAEAEGTAAEKTKVDKPAAEAAAVTEPSSEPVAKQPKPKATRAPAKKPAAAKPAQPKAQPAPRRRSRDAGELVIVRAHARYVRSSARKARLVCDGIRGKSVAEARAILAFSPRNIAEAWTKLLESAVANAENNHDLVGEDLKVHAVYADEGPTIKRFRPRAMGRATQIRKRTSHLTIQLTPKGG